MTDVPEQGMEVVVVAVAVAVVAEGGRVESARS